MKALLEKALKDKQEKQQNNGDTLSPEKSVKYKPKYAKGKQQTKPFKK